MPASDLFSLTEFASYMQQDVDTSSATVARRVASGWLLQATRLTDYTLPISDSLFGWALELAAIAFRNPDGATQESLDDHNVSWDKARRAEILKAAAALYGGAGSPTYSFPDWDWHWQTVPVADPLTA
jgi:hypothetical protein